MARKALTFPAIAKSALVLISKVKKNAFNLLSLPLSDAVNVKPLGVPAGGLPLDKVKLKFHRSQHRNPLNPDNPVKGNLCLFFRHSGLNVHCHLFNGFRNPFVPFGFQTVAYLP